MKTADDLNTKVQIVLPINPETYYGSSIAVENLSVGMKLYIGNHNQVEEVVITSLTKDIHSYYIETDSAVYVAFPGTRVQYSTNYKQ